MKFTLMFKTPDVLDQIQEQIDDHKYDDDEYYSMLEDAKIFAQQYVKWSEYITIEFDSELKTVKVLKCV